MTHRWKAAMVMCAIAAAPLFAQSKPSAPAAAKATGKESSPDLAFAREAAVGGMAEVEMGKLAQEKAVSAEVKAFGARMVADHSKANDELKQLAQTKKITLPTALDPKHTALRDRLARLPGDAFDKEYMYEMVMDHQHDVAAFMREAKSGKDADLKAWAGKTLPTLQEHLKLSKDAAVKVGRGRGSAGK